MQLFSCADSHLSLWSIMIIINKGWQPKLESDLYTYTQSGYTDPTLLFLLGWNSGSCSAFYNFLLIYWSMISFVLRI